MVSRTLGLALCVGLLAAGCNNDPSTMHRVNANGPMPSVTDERNGVVAAIELRSDGHYDTSLRRIENGAYVSLTPVIPDDHMGQINSAFWHDGSALVGDLQGHIFRYTPEHGAWETLDMTQCDPTLSQTLLVDAPAQDDAWVLATGDFGGATLCHFDGRDFTSAESLDFVPLDVVDFQGVLYAIDASGDRVVHRASGESAWTAVPGISSTMVFDTLVVRDDAVYLRLLGASDSMPSYWRVSGQTGPIDGVPGIGGARWHVDQMNQTHQSCWHSWVTGDTVCEDVIDVMELHVLRTDGTAREVGYLRLESPGSLWVEPVVVGADQLILTSSSGDVWVTPS